MNDLYYTIKTIFQHFITFLYTHSVIWANAMHFTMLFYRERRYNFLCRNTLSELKFILHSLNHAVFLWQWTWCVVAWRGPINGALHWLHQHQAKPEPSVPQGSKRGRCLKVMWWLLGEEWSDPALQPGWPKTQPSAIGKSFSSKLLQKSHISLCHPAPSPTESAPSIPTQPSS